MSSRAWLLVAILVLALVTLARIRLIDSLPDQGYFAKYITFADGILKGQIARDRLTDLSPGYLWFVVLMRGMGAGFVAIRRLQIVFVSVAALLLGLAVRRFGLTAAIAAPLFLLGSRAALVCATEIEPETLILFLSAGSIAALMAGRGTETHEGASAWCTPPDSRLLLTGFLLGLSAICRPVAVLVIMALALMLRSWRLAVAGVVPILMALCVNVALTGEATLMDPGTVFYEGMNPNAAGYEGVQPRIVNDLERMSLQPDYLHVAYRIIAARSLGRQLSRADSNRFWTGKAVAFVRTYPVAAMRLTLRKLLFAIHSYDAYDLSTMARKSFLLQRFPFVPFGVLTALAGAAILFRRREVMPLIVFALCTGATLVAFYVTARQRNAMVPAVVALAAIGLADVVGRRRMVPAVIVIVTAILLSIDGPPQTEDANGWTGAHNGFDEAIALEQQSRWADADRILQRLEEDGYQPIRENRAVSSLAYYRAAAALHLGRNPQTLLNRAEEEAPGNEHVLALRAHLGDERARDLLSRLHDTVTAARATRDAESLANRK